MDLIMGLADRMAVMHHGALLAVDTPERIIANEIVQSAYLGDPL
jgi:branched-chain amino acid transport system ATP-binding protein